MADPIFTTSTSHPESASQSMSFSTPYPSLQMRGFKRCNRASHKIVQHLRKIQPLASPWEFPFRWLNWSVKLEGGVHGVYAGQSQTHNASKVFELTMKAESWKMGKWRLRSPYQSYCELLHPNPLHSLRNPPDSICISNSPFTWTAY